MKRILAATVLGSVVTTAAAADPTVMLGVSIALGQGPSAGQVGVSARVISDNAENSWVATIGGTYFPVVNEVGFDVGVGYNFTEAVATFSYDLVNQNAVLSSGWANLAAPENVAAERPITDKGQELTVEGPCLDQSVCLPPPPPPGPPPG
jgi:opacity protein-like surface antigen